MEGIAKQNVPCQLPILKLIKMRKVVLLIILAGLWVMHISAQTTYFNKLVATKPLEGGYCIEYLDSFYYGASLCHDSVMSERGLCLYKFDLAGNLVKSAYYHSPDKSFWWGEYGLIPTHDSCFVIKGGITQNDTIYTRCEGYLLKFDRNLDTLWCRMFSDPDGLSPVQTNNIIQQNISSARQTPDKGFILTGISHGYYEYNYMLSVIKTDSMGIVEWTKVFGDSAVNYHNKSHTIEVLGDSGYLIPCTGLGATNGFILLRLDLSGEIVYCKEISVPPYLFWSDFHGSALTSDSCILVSLDYLYYRETTPSYYYRSTPMVYKIDAFKGEVKWANKYQFYDAISYGIRVLHDKGIVIYGKEWNIDTLDLNNYGIYGFLLRLNEDGDSLWYRKKEYISGVSEDFHYLYDLMPTPDRGFIGIGVRVGQPSTCTWLLKMDSLGCAVPNCLDTILGIKVMEQFKDVFLVVYPNPVSEQLTIGINEYHESIRELAIYDLSGRCIVRKEIHSPSHVMDVSHYKAGLYILRVLTENGKWVEQKFVKE